MTEQQPHDDHHVTRRAFLQYSAAVSAATAGAYGIFLKTDAITAEVVPLDTKSGRGNGQEDFPYGYADPPGS